jgi:hypothetical protein
MASFRNALFRLLKLSFGKVSRSIQRTLLVQSPAGEKMFALEKSPTLWEVLCAKATETTAAFVNLSMRNAMYFSSRTEIFRWVRQTFHDSFDRGRKSGVILEFGVYSGISIDMISSIFPSRRVLGYDSFLGLPDEWSGFKYEGGGRGTFDLGGILPEVRENVELVPGLFQETVPASLGEISSLEQRIALVHLDADIYSSTKFVLDSILPYIDDDILLVFDEFFNYPGWEMHEFRAFDEFVTENKLRYQYLAFSESSVCVKVLRSVR